MLTTEPTPEMVAEWKRIFDIYHSVLKPNRKTGIEVDQYFRKTYPHQAFNSARFREVAALNVTENEFSRSKLPAGLLPRIQSYRTGHVLVGIDLSSGEFHVECENIDESIPVYDDLFAYRGLDAEDLKNFFLVAEYVKLTQTKDKEVSV